MIISRRRLLIAGSTAFAGGVVGAPFVARAQQAEFTYKYANNLPPAHPMNMRAQEMAARDQGRDQRPLRPPDLSEQPARLRHRHAEPAALRAASSSSPSPA